MFVQADEFTRHNHELSFIGRLGRGAGSGQGPATAMGEPAGHAFAAQRQYHVDSPLSVSPEEHVPANRASNRASQPKAAVFLLT